MLFPDLDKCQVKIWSYDNGLQNTVLQNYLLDSPMFRNFYFRKLQDDFFLHLKNKYATQGYLPVQYKTFLSVIFITILKI